MEKTKEELYKEYTDLLTKTITTKKRKFIVGGEDSPEFEKWKKDNDISTDTWCDFEERLEEELYQEEINTDIGIKWAYEDHMLDALKYHHRCGKGYYLQDLKRIGQKEERFGLHPKLNAKIERYKATLTCHKCHTTLKIIYEYGYNSKTDWFNVASVVTEE